jgi:hypothetical protein
LIVLTTLLALALAAAPPLATPLDGPPPARVRTPGVGRVLQVTRARAYLDAGAQDGLAVGQVLTLWRGDQEAGRCQVETVAPAHATCTGTGVRAGDAFRLSAAGGPAEPKAVVLPPLPDERELARRGGALEVAPVPLVVFKGTAPGAPALATPRDTVAEVALGAAAWSSTGARTWDVVTLDAAVHGAAVGPLSLDLDLRAERWVSHAGDRFRARDDARLYVWQAQLGYAPPGSALSVSAGRILPWTVPGATVVDGAMVGWRREGLEAGLFGGLVPAPDTLDPRTDRSTGGGFWALERRWGKEVVLRQEGRLAFVRSPELGSRGELEANASLHAGAPLDLFASARAGAGGRVHSPGYLDAARLEVGSRPAERLSLSGGFEYGGLSIPWMVEPPISGASRNRRADLTASYDLGRARLSGLGGFSRDAVSGLQRSWAGADLQLPRLFTPRLDLSMGYLEELGWLHGRSAWLQAVARPWDALRLIARASWSHEAGLAMDAEQVGLSLSAAAELTRRVGLRLTALGLVGFGLSGGEAATMPFGVSASAAVYALF